MMLLVAPLAPSDASAADSTDLRVMFEGALRVDSAGNFILLSRTVYKPRELWQTWVELDPSRVMPEVRRAWLVRLKRLLFLVAEIRLSNPVPEARAEIVELEEHTGKLAERICSITRGLANYHPVWVSRTLLYQNERPTPSAWLDDSATEYRVSVGPLRELRLLLGWGGNVFFGWDLDVDQPEQTEVIMGLVDAQFLWLEVSTTADASSDIAHAVIDRPGQLTARQFAQYLQDLDSMTDTIALHRLNYDDLLMNMQGARRDVAKTLLSSWGYHEIAERIDQRIPIVSMVTARESARTTRAYQTVVSWVLSALALLSMSNLALDLYGLAITGTATIPGSENGFLDILRRVNADQLIAVVTCAVLALLLLVRKARKDLS